MREFNYERAWRELAKPRFDNLAPGLRDLFYQVRAASGELASVPQDAVNPFPDTEVCRALVAEFDKFSSEELSEAACVIYYYGHWGYTKEGKEAQIGGAYWRFQRLADHVVIKRGDRNNWEAQHWKGLVDTFMDHKEGTELDNDELADKHRALFPEPFVVVSVQHVNHKPHPYVIGSKHIHAAQAYGGMLGKEVLEKVGCAVPECGLPYSQHTSERAIFLKLTRDVEHKEYAAKLKAMVPEMEKDGIDGVAFIRCGFKILPPKPGYHPQDERGDTSDDQDTAQRGV